MKKFNNVNSQDVGKVGGWGVKQKINPVNPV